jgi:hypothetical protein
MNPAKEWKCDACPAVEIQTGPRALELLPTPPYGWSLVDTTRILPPRAVGDGASKVKVGATRDTTRRVFCVACTGVMEEERRVRDA